MGNECSFTWQAPYLYPSDDPRRPFYTSTQVCVLPRGHKGDHRSIFKVTRKNDNPKAYEED